MKIENEVIEKIIDGVEYIEEITYRVFDDGTKEVACTFQKTKETPEPAEPEPSQLDRIEAIVSQTKEEIAQEARDEYTLELIENGVI